MANIEPLIQEYMLDFASNNNFFYVNGVQGDGHSVRYVRVSLMNNGQPYYIDVNNINIAVRGTTSNGDQYLDVETSIVIDRSTIQFELTQNMLLYPGKGVYEVCIMAKDNNQILTSFPFNVITSKSGFDTRGITESNDFINLIKTLSEVTQAIETCNEATNNANKASEYANKQGSYADINADYAKEQGDYAKEYQVYAKEQGDYAKEQGDAAKQAIKDIQSAIGIDDTQISHTSTWSSKFIKQQLDDHLYYIIDGSVTIDIPEVLSSGDDEGNVAIASSEVFAANDKQGNTTITSPTITNTDDGNGNVNIITE